MDDANHHGKDEMNLVVLRKLRRLADDGHGKSQGKASSGIKANDPLVGKKGVATGKTTNDQPVLHQRTARAQKQASA